jgi:Basic region leucine zipper
MDLAGSTSAEVRRMNEDERALVHYKRRLRNRESAKRSRARRQATLNDIQAEVCELRDVAQRLLDRCARLARAGDRAVAEAETLRKENSLLESMLRSESAAALPTERRCGV